MVSVDRSPAAYLAWLPHDVTARDGSIELLLCLGSGSHICILTRLGAWRKIPDMHSLPEAAKLLGVSPKTLRAQIKNGALTARKVSRDWYVTPEEVDRYRREHRRTTGDVA